MRAVLRDLVALFLMLGGAVGLAVVAFMVSTLLCIAFVCVAAIVSGVMLGLDR